MKASKIFHRNEYRIKVDFPFNKETETKLKQLPDAKWSNTHNAWHIPYNKIAFAQLKKLFPAIEYASTATHDTVAKSPPGILKKDAASPLQKPGNVIIHVAGRKILVKLPKHEVDTKFLLSFRYSRFEKAQFSWVIPHYPGNLELLKEYFKERIASIVIDEAISIAGSVDEARRIEKNDLLIIKTKAGRLKIYYGFNDELTYALKKMPYSHWNPQNKRWSIPYTEKLLAEVKTIAARQNLRLIFELESVDSSKETRPSPAITTNDRKCPEEYLLKLKELRYSENTVKTYKNSFEEFINYYRKVPLSDITETMIIDFLRSLVIERRTSSSYQNQAINAIKFYYERVLGRPRSVYMIERPIQEKTLPVVLSVEEISALLKATENIKHKAILMLGYAAGLRVSELVNIRLKDIDSKRMQVRIEQSKGKKDRYSVLSNRLLEVLRIYFDKMPTLRKIKRAASQHTSRRFCSTFNFAQPHPKPTHHPTSGRLTI
jgi:integrase/recombinase XerD